MKSIFQQRMQEFEELRCPTCQGSGQLNDSEPGDIGYNTWECGDCKGSGFKGGRIQTLSGVQLGWQSRAGKDAAV